MRTADEIKGGHLDKADAEKQGRADKTDKPHIMVDWKPGKATQTVPPRTQRNRLTLGKEFVILLVGILTKANIRAGIFVRRQEAE